MEESEIIGLIVTGMVSIGALITLVVKAVSPFVDLNANVLVLNKTMQDFITRADKRLDGHGDKIDNLQTVSADHEARIKNLEEE
ncbi:MAG: hypothetical protein RR842_13695 [Gordonibacter sp.]|uniref:hypothetical protein n=1 Tax=Gordonibacter sp. TaxID=1968902 RepID=UPI002FCC6DA0